MKILLRLICLLMVAAWLNQPECVYSQTDAPLPQPVVETGPATAEMDKVEMNFQDTPIQAVIEYYAEALAKRSIIQAPNIAGVITFRSQAKLTIDEAKAALESVFAINNIAVIPMGEKFLKAVLIGTAKQEGVPFGGEGKTMPASDTLMTQVISLKFAEVADVVQALQPYMHSYGQMLPLPKSNSVLITETAGNVNQMLEIVKYIDVPSALRMETRIFQIAHAKSADVMQRLQSVIQELAQQVGVRATAGAAPAARPGGIGTAGTEDTIIEGKVIITADERTNKIFILSRPSNFDFFNNMIAELDTRVEPEVIMKVVALDYATADDAAALVSALVTGGSVSDSRRTKNTGTLTGRTSAPTSVPLSSATTAGGSGGETDTGFLQFAQGVRVLPDPRTNALLLMATKEDMLRIEALIASIDTPVAQVLIEVVIAEVTLDNNLTIGVDLTKRLFDLGRTTSGGGSSTSKNMPIQLPQTPLPPIPPAAGLMYFATFQNLKLDAVIQALATTSKAKVLSTPVIQTLDNQEASILVGSSVPVPVSTVSSVVGGVGSNLSSGSLNANIEYKDVAIELKVTPRINPGGYVRMDIVQKVNDLGANNNISGVSVPTITKREAKSSVAVQDGSTIALGGLIQESKELTQTKVPILGDIPLLGFLFRTQSNVKKRTELIIFIRPTVMRNDPAATAEARRRSRMLKAVDELELDKQFQRPGDSTNLVPNKSGGATTTNAPAADNEMVRRAAKLKVLEEQTKSQGN